MKFSTHEVTSILKFHEALTFLQIEMPPEFLGLVNRLNEGDTEERLMDVVIITAGLISLATNNKIKVDVMANIAIRHHEAKTNDCKTA